METESLVDSLSAYDPTAPLAIAWSAAVLNGEFITEPVTAADLQGGRVVLRAVSLESCTTGCRIHGVVTAEQLLNFLLDLRQPKPVWALYHVPETGCTHAEQIVNAFPFDEEIWMTTPSWAVRMASAPRGAR
jgi:hypothetical protein